MKNSDVKIESQIYDDDGFPILQFVVEGWQYAFTVKSVKEDSREWLQGILKRQFAEIYAQAYNKAKRDIREKYADFVKSIEG